MAAKKAASKAKVLPTLKKGGGGLNKHVPDANSRNLVKLGKAIAYTDEQIARLVGISLKTLKAHYPDELARGAEQVHGAIAGNLARIAMDRNHPRAVVAAIFFLKSRAGWADMTIVPDGEDENGNAVAGAPVSFTLKIGEKAGGANG